MHATASIPVGAHGDSVAAASTYKPAASREQIDRLEDAEETDGSCLKGILVALSIEAAAAILACGVWQVWHVVR